MEAPTIPLETRYKAVGWSALMMLWWIGLWGIADTVIHTVFKGNTLKELGVYISFVLIVLIAVYQNPELVNKF
jgi:predicted membrane channel-forming protein YqfA (hemolysin III family)